MFDRLECYRKTPQFEAFMSLVTGTHFGHRKRMKRRTALGELAGSFITTDDDATGSSARVSPYANKVLPQVQRTTAGLEPHTGVWQTEQMLHLLRRTTFGPSRAHLAQIRSMSMLQTVDTLLASGPEEPSMPLNVDSRDLVAVGEPWVYALYQDPAAGSFNPTGVRTNSLKAWWLGLILNQGFSLREKMTLFWHNHFVTERSVVNDPRFTYRYVALLRRNSLGNWKALTRAISYDGAMLRYLNGNTNTRTSANENYGRELLELFTIGKGPEAGVGDYTNYTEADVKAAARALTGWQEDATVLITAGSTPWKFTSSRHDTTDKQFSVRFGSHLTKGGTDGYAELDDVLNMIFAQDETAKFLCRKLYRWFVYYVIDDWTEANIITPLATILRSNNYELTPVLSVLLKSAHFFDPVNMGCGIKGPIDHAAGLVRLFAIAFPQGDVVNQYKLWTYLNGKLTAMDQDIGDPPNVAGWAAYYQTPQFYELWINSDTLPKRTALSDTLIRTGYKITGFTLQADALAFAKTLSNPGDPVSLIDESAQILFAISLTAGQKSFLKDILIPGLPDYEWTVEWAAHINDPNNTTKAALVKTKLLTLYAFMASMPEFQLM
jgi:uncharacterized protein (DUF1800 family)